MRRAGIAGAGLLGRLLAVRLIQSGWSVTLFDEQAENSADNCSMTAAGLLTPLTELERNDALIFSLGIESLRHHWPNIIRQCDLSVYFQTTGSLVFAHPRDRAELTRYIAGITAKLNTVSENQAQNSAYYRHLQTPDLEKLEPELGKMEQAYYFPDEGNLDNQTLLQKLGIFLQQHLEQWHTGVTVQATAPGIIHCHPRSSSLNQSKKLLLPLWEKVPKADEGFKTKQKFIIFLKKLLFSTPHPPSAPSPTRGEGKYVENLNYSTMPPRSDKAIPVGTTYSSDGVAYKFDMVFDCRGLGGKAHFPELRGVRGELFWLHAPNVHIHRPVRLLNPRYSLYIAPRPNATYIVGASEIESEDKSPISARTLLELLSSACYLHSGFAEARLMKTMTHLRPTLADNLPKIKHMPQLIAINGLYRHGFLIAPAIVEDVLRYLHAGSRACHHPTLWEPFHASVLQ